MSNIPDILLDPGTWEHIDFDNPVGQERTAPNATTAMRTEASLRFRRLIAGNVYRDIGTTPLQELVGGANMYDLPVGHRVVSPVGIIAVRTGFIELPEPSLDSIPEGEISPASIVWYTKPLNRGTETRTWVRTYPGASMEMLRSEPDTKKLSRTTHSNPWDVRLGCWLGKSTESGKAILRYALPVNHFEVIV